MLMLDVKIGQAVTIGKETLVKVADKRGRKVRLAIATSLSPIKLLPPGLDLTTYVEGIDGVRQPAPKPGRVLQAANK